MLNYIWLALVLLAVTIGGWTGHLKEVTDGAFDGAKTAVTIALGLIGIMALWLGVMRLAERAGLVQKLARGLRPVMTRLFPGVPNDHPAMGSMLMNMAANMLGLGNAATPLGLRAMRDLEALNPQPGRATNAMCTFLALNTSSVQLIPTTAIAILVAAGSSNPTAIVGTSLLATLCAATVAVTMVKLLEKLPLFRGKPAALGGDAVAGHDVTGGVAVAGDDVPGRTLTNQRTQLPAPRTSGIPEAKEPRPASAGDTVPSYSGERAGGAGGQAMPLWARGLLAAFAVFFLALFVRQVFPEWFGLAYDSSGVAPSYFVRGVSALSLFAIPMLIAFFVLYAALRGVKVYDEFVEGAKEGFGVILKIIPFLVTMLVAIGMFKGAGGIDLLARALSPILTPLHFPTDLLPIALMRPLSGGATLALFTDVVHRLGPENIVSLMAATIYGSTETTFYVAAVYFGSVGIKQTRHAIPAGLLADLAGVIASVAICRAVL